MDAAKNIEAAGEAGMPPIEELRKAVAERRKAKAPKVAPAPKVEKASPAPNQTQVPVGGWFA